MMSRLVTFRVSEKLFERMKKQQFINWSGLFRELAESQCDELESGDRRILVKAEV